MHTIIRGTNLGRLSSTAAGGKGTSSTSALPRKTSRDARCLRKRIIPLSYTAPAQITSSVTALRLLTSTECYSIDAAIFLCQEHLHRQCQPAMISSRPHSCRLWRDFGSIQAGKRYLACLACKHLVALTSGLFLSLWERARVWQELQIAGTSRAAHFFFRVLLTLAQGARCAPLGSARNRR